MQIVRVFALLAVIAANLGVVVGMGSSAEVYEIIVPIVDMGTTPEKTIPANVAEVACGGGHILPGDAPGRMAQLRMGDVVYLRDVVGEGFTLVKTPELLVLQNGKELAALSGWIPSDAGAPRPAERLEFQSLVKVPVAVVRDEPSEHGKEEFRLTCGTKIWAKRLVTGGYSCVRLAQGKIGWIKADEYVAIEEILLPRESSTSASDKKIDQLRASVVAVACSFDRSPVRWGGVSGFDPAEAFELMTGCDASGLVYLALRAGAAMLTPRNTTSQMYAMQPIASGADLKDGDLIYSIWDKPGAGRSKIKNVMMVVNAAENDVLELTALYRSVGTELQGVAGAGVRLIKTTEHPEINAPLAALRSGQQAVALPGVELPFGPRTIHLGTFFTPQLISEAQARLLALC